MSLVGEELVLLIFTFHWFECCAISVYVECRSLENLFIFADLCNCCDFCFCWWPLEKSLYFVASPWWQSLGVQNVLFLCCVKSWIFCWLLGCWLCMYREKREFLLKNYINVWHGLCHPCCLLKLFNNVLIVCSDELMSPTKYFLHFSCKLMCCDFDFEIKTIFLTNTCTKWCCFVLYLNNLNNLNFHCH